jgi:hypothetical protein
MLEESDHGCTALPLHKRVKPFQGSGETRAVIDGASQNRLTARPLIPCSLALPAYCPE